MGALGFHSALQQTATDLNAAAEARRLSAALRRVGHLAALALLAGLSGCGGTSNDGGSDGSAGDEGTMDSADDSTGSSAGMRDAPTEGSLAECFASGQYTTCIEACQAEGLLCASGGCLQSSTYVGYDTLDECGVEEMWLYASGIEPCDNKIFAEGDFVRCCCG